MKLGFLDLPSDERRLYIEQAALRRNVSPVVLEKDFWVCWLLGILFESPDRISRHYADTAALAKHPAASRALDQHDLRVRVFRWKSQFFGSSWANYDLATPGNFRLVPPAERLPALQRDYRAMRDMYLIEPANFEDILATLAELENRINNSDRKNLG